MGKYRSQMTIQPQSKNVDYLIDPTFINVNRLSVLSFGDHSGDNRDSFSYYYVPNVEIKDFNVLIDGKSFFDLPVKMRKKLTKNVLRWVEIMTTQVVIY